MEIKELEEKKEYLEENKVSDLFKSIITGKYVTEIIKTDSGDFEIKFPKARDLAEIGRLTAFRLNGISVQCFDENTYLLIRYTSTLDVLVVKGPAWYELAKKKNPNFSWLDIPSQNLIAEVYAKAYEFREEVQKQLDGNQNKTDRTMADNGDGKDAAESGLFNGIGSDN